MTQTLNPYDITSPEPVHPIILTNGRAGCLQAMVQSLSHVRDLSRGSIVDDSGDPGYRQILRAVLPGWQIYSHREPQGYTDSMQDVWAIAARHDYVFLIEDDFIFERDFRLRQMADVLERTPHLVQVVLLRQAWFPNEIGAGGLIPALEEIGHRFTGSYSWVEHRACWSTNPTVFRGGQWALEHPWPAVESSEWVFGQTLFSDEPDTFCAYWGDGKTPWVHHIGERTGFGY